MSHCLWAAPQPCTAGLSRQDPRRDPAPGLPTTPEIPRAGHRTAHTSLQGCESHRYALHRFPPRLRPTYLAQSVFNAPATQHMVPQVQVLHNVLKPRQGAGPNTGHST